MRIYKQANRTEDGSTIALTTVDDRVQRFHAIWLRDNAPDDLTRSPDNGQKLLQITDIAHDVSISEVALNNEGEIVIHFSDHTAPVIFKARWLHEHCYDTGDTQPRVVKPGWLPESVTPWGAELGNNMPIASYEDVKHNDNALCEWLSAVAHYGVAKIVDGPVEPQSLLHVAALFGYVRETNYGRWFEVRTETNPSNLAYTGLALQPHTDNPYRDPVPTLQILYCLENSTDGGDSIVVDGFNAAQRLRDESPHHFDLLTRYNAQFEYSGSSNVHLTTNKRMIELGAHGELIGIRFNNRSCTAFTDIPYSQMTDYYTAYQHFASIVDHHTSSIQFRLEPGECFIVDNTRVLHGRTAYTGTGTRWAARVLSRQRWSFV